jgi:chemotaxis protein MotB
MRAATSLLSILFCASIFFVGGCGPECKDLRVQNNTQRKRIAQLESEVESTKLQIAQMERQLASAKEGEGIETDTLKQKVAALEKAVQDKETLIDSMKKQLMHGGAQLPVELSTMLEDFAAKEDMVTYDADRGIVKFKSDLLFEPGSDKVAPAAAEAVKSLCKILASEQAQQFDVTVAGHTDNIPIGKPATRAKHPTNWHLSTDRAISVLELMVQDGIAPERLSARGFGEYRPIVPNAPNKKGNPQNRRVEIYIVPKGM